MSPLFDRDRLSRSRLTKPGQKPYDPTFLPDTRRTPNDPRPTLLVPPSWPFTPPPPTHSSSNITCITYTISPLNPPHGNLSPTYITHYNIIKTSNQHPIRYICETWDRRRGCTSEWISGKRPQRWFVGYRDKGDGRIDHC